MNGRPSLLVGIVVGAALTAGLTVPVAVSSMGKISPTESREREVYYPNSESLAPDEMRVIACGTGTKDEITTRMAVVEEATWAPPGTMAAIPPKPSDRDAYSKRLGWTLPFSEFIASGKWDVDDVLRPIYKEAGDVTGREFKYPGDE